jgi:hypothetical protein
VVYGFLDEDVMAAKMLSFLENFGFCYDFFVALDNQIQAEDYHDAYTESLLSILID